MNDSSARRDAIRALLRSQPVAALGTLHRGQPFVSMVPYALLPDGEGVVIHVSRLASHTRDMERSPRVSLMVAASPSTEVPVRALARLTIQGDAAPCPAADPRHEAARQAYLGRFAASAELFGFADFSLFVVRPVSARWVGGFGQAVSLLAPAVVDALRTG